tara:strand:+ start:45079 stop:45213 length:135 start_codon:yes stop_codon:yes gene_type:complete
MQVSDRSTIEIMTGLIFIKRFYFSKYNITQHYYITRLSHRTMRK